jgi:hypothetical protein
VDADAKLLGRIPSPPDERDYKIRSLLDVAAIAPLLPAKWINRSLGKTLTLRFDQQEGSCVGRSTALTKIVQERRDLRRTYIFDGLMIWQRSKENDGIGDPEQDRGTYIRTALDALRVAAPHSGAWDPRMRIASYWRIETIDEAKAAILSLGPIVVGSTWYRSWFEPEADGQLPKPDVDVGGHAFVLYGFDDNVGKFGSFRLANSWGYEWGQRGDAWISYEHFGEAMDEAWRVVDAIDVPKGG